MRIRLLVCALLLLLLVPGLARADGVNRITIEAAGLSVGSAGSIRGGQTAYNTGTGWWLGYTGGAYKFSIGDPAATSMTWDGTNLALAGSNATVTGATIRTAASGARAQMDGTSLKSIDAGGNTLVEMDGTGISITPSTSGPLEAHRMYRFGSGAVGMGYLASESAPTLIFVSPFAILFEADSTTASLGSNGSGGSIFSANNILATSGYQVYSGGSAVAGATFTGCPGQFVQSMTTVGGIVTNVDCGSPLDARATDLAALRSRVADLETLVARLLPAGTK